MGMGWDLSWRKTLTAYKTNLKKESFTILKLFYIDNFFTQSFARFCDAKNLHCAKFARTTLLSLVLCSTIFATNAFTQTGADTDNTDAHTTQSAPMQTSTNTNAVPTEQVQTQTTPAVQTSTDTKQVQGAQSVQAQNAPVEQVPTAQNSAVQTSSNANVPATEQAQSSNTPEDTEAPSIGLIPLEIDLPQENALVKKYLTQYDSASGKKWLTAVMQSGAPYRSYIQSKIVQMGLPACLEFLPVIESSFRVNATSKSGAKGLWQFMKNSIAPYNIRVNEWMDERCDPWLSTDAALKKLKENYDELGDWCLALAAYNCGLGAVKRIVKAHKSSDYWELSAKKAFKNETMQYVPKFLAIAHLLSNNHYYGIDLPPYQDLPLEQTADFETFAIKRSVDLNLIAKEVGISAETMLFLNPALTYTVTPPDITYNLRVPSAYKDAIFALVQDTSKLLIKYHRYTIRSGDTLYALSRHYDVSISMIEQANRGLKANNLQIGKTILIPAFKDVSPYSRKKSSDKVVYDDTYTVKKGETLWSISLKYNVQVEDLADANNMDVNTILRIGSTLKVPIIK